MTTIETPIKEFNASPEFGFKISTGLKRIIGRDLITNNLVAVFELVKNSFDAHASEVNLVFEEDRLLIIDDGKGMSQDDLINKWLFVAYSAKSDGTEDDYRKHIKQRKAYAGSKGVGRFSCDRLGSTLKMHTRSTGESQEVHELVVDWNLFEKDSKVEFDTIPVEYNSIDQFPKLPKNVSLTNGTVLEIAGLRDIWDRNELLKLKSALTKLINPFGGQESSPFQVNLTAENELLKDIEEMGKVEFQNDNGHKIVNGKIENFIFETLRAKTTLLDVKITDKGQSIESSLIDRGELIYRIKEPNIFELIQDSDFKCQLYYLNMSAKLTFAQRMGVSTKEFGSIFLFKNGFRIFPVGESGDDAFKIDLRKQQGYARYLGTRDVVGRIDVFGNEEKFKESTSRDQGLIHNSAYLQLEDCFKEKCLKRLEKYVVGVNWKDPLDTDTEDISRLTGDKARSRIIELVSRLANAKDVTLLDYSGNLVGILDEKSADFEKSLANLKFVADKTKDEELSHQISKAEQAYLELKQAEREARERAEREKKARKTAEQKALTETVQRKKTEKAYEEEKKRNLFLTSSTTLDYDNIVNLHHQIGIYSADIHNILAFQMEKIKYGETLDNESLLNLFEQLSFKNQQVLSVSKFATKANFRLESDTIEDDILVFITQYTQEICELYSGDRVDISIESEAEPFITSFKPIEISMVIDNLVTNAERANASSISFKIKQPSNKEIEIIITDDGDGLSSDITEKNRIFEKGFSTTIGSGLGLYHVKLILDEMGAGITINNDVEFGTQFIIRMRK